MPNYRRAFVPGGMYFFTLKTERNAPVFSEISSVRLLGDIFREAIVKWQFTIEAVVLLPDHLHAIWSLPTGDASYSHRLAWIKKEFTKRYLAGGGTEQWVSSSRKQHRRRGVWQRKFWEHSLRDEVDFQKHFDYIHWNPVKHGYVNCPSAWPHSSFHRWVAKGVYPADWGCKVHPATPLQEIDTAGE